MKTDLGALILILQTLLGQSESQTTALQQALDAALAAQAVAQAEASQPIFVGSWDALQARVDAAPVGATILLDPHATYGAVTCRKPLVVRSAVRPVAGRVLPTAALATLDAWTVSPGADDCALEDVRVNLVQVGTGSETALEQYPVRPRLTRILMTVSDTKRCIALHAIDAVLEQSYVTGCRKASTESQAVWINGPGPYRIEDNRLEGASENILIGGDRLRVDQMVPSDITIVGNDLAKPLAWKVKGSVVKNILEVKVGRRVVVRGNRLDGIWPDGQTGFAFMLTPRNQYGDNPWVVVEYVLVEDNLVVNASGGVNLLGDDDLQPAQRTNHVTFRNNRFVLSKASMGGTGRGLMVGRGPTDLTWEGNVVITDGGQGWYHYTGKAGTSRVDVIPNAVFRNNVWTAPFVSDTTSTAAAALAAYYPGVVWEGNTVTGATVPKWYPEGTRLLTTDALKAEFSDWTTAKR